MTYARVLLWLDIGNISNYQDVIQFNGFEHPSIDSGTCIAK